MFLKPLCLSNSPCRYMLQDEKGKFSSAIKWISAAGDPSIVSHPVVDVNIELLWAGVVRRQFIVSRLWNIVNLVVFVMGQDSFNGYITSNNLII